MGVDLGLGIGVICTLFAVVLTLYRWVFSSSNLTEDRQTRQTNGGRTDRQLVAYQFPGCLHVCQLTIIHWSGDIYLHFGEQSPLLSSTLRWIIDTSWKNTIFLTIDKLRNNGMMRTSRAARYSEVISSRLFISSLANKRAPEALFHERALDMRW